MGEQMKVWCRRCRQEVAVEQRGDEVVFVRHGDRVGHFGCWASEKPVRLHRMS